MGSGVMPMMKKLFINPETSYIHAKNLMQECYADFIDRFPQWPLLTEIRRLQILA